MNTTAITNTKRPVLELINSSKPKFAGRLPEGMTADRFMYGLATACQKNEALLKCDPNSVILAAYEAAEVGCDLSPSLALGWLIPYGTAAQFQPSYRLFIQKAYETGCVTAFYAEVVYANDLFTREFAPKRALHHVPPSSGDRGEPIGAYAHIEFMDGRFDWEYLTKDQIERHRNASKQPNSLMWKTFWEEGWKKTPIRVLAKRLPMSNPGMEKLVSVVNRDAANDSVDMNMPESAAAPKPVEIGPEELSLRNRVTELCGQLQINRAGEQTLLGQYRGRLPELVTTLETRVAEESKSSPRDNKQNGASFVASDEDLPQAMTQENSKTVTQGPIQDSAAPQPGLDF